MQTHWFKCGQARMHERAGSRSATDDFAIRLPMCGAPAVAACKKLRGTDDNMPVFVGQPEVRTEPMKSLDCIPTREAAHETRAELPEIIAATRNGPASTAGRNCEFYRRLRGYPNGPARSKQ